MGRGGFLSLVREDPACRVVPSKKKNNNKEIISYKEGDLGARLHREENAM